MDATGRPIKKGNIHFAKIMLAKFSGQTFETNQRLYLFRTDRGYQSIQGGLHGQPAAPLASRSGSRLYLALDTTDQVAIFDTAHDRLVESLDVTAPGSIYAEETAAPAST